MGEMVEKHGHLKKRSELLPRVPTFPKLDKVSFSLPSLQDHSNENKG